MIFVAIRDYRHLPERLNVTDDLSKSAYLDNNGDLVVATENSSTVFEIEDTTRVIRWSPDESVIAVLSVNDHSHDVSLDVWNVDIRSETHPFFVWSIRLRMLFGKVALNGVPIVNISP